MLSRNYGGSFLVYYCVWWYYLFCDWILFLVDELMIFGFIYVFILCFYYVLYNFIKWYCMKLFNELVWIIFGRYVSFFFVK